MTADRIKEHSGFLDIIKRQSAHLIAIHAEQPRLASIFSCQDRWLMAQVGLALYFEGLSGPGNGGLTAANFIAKVVGHEITSRNTAAAFLNEMLNYGVITRQPHATDRRMRTMTPAPSTIEAARDWMRLHLATLDALDDGSRYQTFQALPPETLARLQPVIAAGLVHDETIRKPSQAFAHFMWMTSGFLITERLILALEDITADTDRFPTKLTSTADLTAGLNLSRSHSARKVNEAENLGILGWTGTKGRSPMWISRDFATAFLDIQAAKLAVIDAAFASYCVNAWPLNQSADE